MNVKKYSAATMKEALEMVKGDLGRDAVILQTRTYRTGTFLGMGGREVVEITATLDDGSTRRVRPPSRAGEAGPPRVYSSLGRLEAGDDTAHRETTGTAVCPAASERASTVAVQEAQEDRTESCARPVRAAAQVGPGGPFLPAPLEMLENLEREVVGIKTMVQNLLGKDRNRTIADMPFNLMKLYHELMENGVEEATARGLVVRLWRDLDANQCRDRGMAVEKLIESICGLVRVSGPIRRNSGAPRVAALIGPTGVGKTTTIAKLAANFKLQEKKEVGLITIDTYRIAAVEQLKVYADIIGVPLNVVLSPRELPGAVAGFDGKDVVLIDTAGRSQMDESRMAELRTFMEAAPPDEVHLVISATTQPRTIGSIVESFSPIATDQMIITKVDEVVNTGSLLAVVTRAQKAISYVTTGQEVPEDIEVAEAHKIAGYILGAIA